MHRAFSPARLAVKLVFFINGFVHATYYARLPRIQDQFAIDNGTIGLVLLASSFGALLAMPFTGWVIIRYGSRRITLFGVLTYCLLFPLIPLMSHVGALSSVFFLLGVSAGMMDVAMNSQAVMVEQRHGKPIMTSFHALFSLGMMLGGLFGALFAKLDTSLLLHFSAIAAVSVAGVLIARYYLIHDKPERKDKEAPAFRLPNAAMVSIGVIAFCCMLGEGAMADWSTNYMENIAGAEKALAPIGLSAFALAMTLGRFVGDSARVRFGDRNLMIICGLISLSGIALAILWIHPYAAITGFFIVGVGLSAVVPIAYSLAGNARDLPPGVGLAMVTTVGYSGFLFGPPIIGFLADLSNLRYAMALVALLFAVMILLAYRYRS